MICRMLLSFHLFMPIATFCIELWNHRKRKSIHLTNDAILFYIWQSFEVLSLPNIIILRLKKCNKSFFFFGGWANYLSRLSSFSFVRCSFPFSCMYTLQQLELCRVSPFNKYTVMASCYSLHSHLFSKITVVSFSRSSFTLALFMKSLYRSKGMDYTISFWITTFRPAIHGGMPFSPCAGDRGSRPGRDRPGSDSSTA